MTTIKKLLTEAHSCLKTPDARLEAEILLEETCGISRSQQFCHADNELSDDQAQAFRAVIERRLAGEPIAHITGHRGFWDMQLRVTADVLIPRPDTECLVEQALERIPAGAEWKIADLGTGSGAIAIALARERPQSHFTATDISGPALAIASENARKLGSENVSFVQGSWYQPLQAGCYDMIVSNPPYISADDAHLQQGDLPAEPAQALVSGADGLDDIRVIITGSIPYLKPGGWLLLEHGYDQAGEVNELMAAAAYSEVFSRKDYGGNDRVTGGRKEK